MIWRMELRIWCTGLLTTLKIWLRFKVIQSEKKLQEDLDKLTEWTTKWMQEWMVRVAQAPTQCLQDGAFLDRLTVLSQSTKTGRPYPGNWRDRRETDWRVGDLGVLLDRELTMKRHVSKTVSTCFYHLRRLRQLRRHVDIDTIKQLVSAFIFSRLDYCNAVLYGIPQSTVGPLQRVQNATAPVTLGLSPRDHVRPALRELHWLPVAHCIRYKVALLMFMVHDNRRPVYLSESVQPVTSNCQRLRSASSIDFTVPRTRTISLETVPSLLPCRSDIMEQFAWVYQISWDSC